MKKLNLFFMAMAMLLMGAGFTACSDDDDNNGGHPTSALRSMRE